MSKRIILILVYLAYTTVLFSQKKDYLENKRKETLKEIENVQNQLDKIGQSKNLSLEKITLIGRQIENRNSLIENLSKEIELSDNEISEKQILINAIEGDIVTIKSVYARLIFAAYKKHRNSNFLAFILSAQTFNQAYKRLQYIKQYTYFRKKQLSVIIQIKEDLAVKKRDLENSKLQKQKLLGSKSNELGKLKREVDLQNQELENLKSKEIALKKDLETKKKVAEKIQKELEAIIVKELERKKENNVKRNSDLVLVSGGFRENRGRLPWPTEKGVIVSSFGEQDHPVWKGVKIRNNGIDISTSPNAKVFSLYEGEVKKVFSYLGANYTVILQHGDFFTVYQNLTSVIVKPGDKVKSKQEIGNLFCSNAGSSSVLHLEIWEERNKLNPEIWLNKN